jgi:anhydro-N-acetylmuramic acid kinase
VLAAFTFADQNDTLISNMRVLGLMSGTSMDGIDAALCEISGSGPTLQAEVIGFECLPYKTDVRERISNAARNMADVREIARLNIEIGRAFGTTANYVFSKFGHADLIGSHGQTVCHLPDEGVTLQIGDAATIAEMTGCDVISNFRARDQACGGQGAPLVPYADWCLLRSRERARCILNIGGISNATILPANASLEDVKASDIGPGNMVIDAVTKHYFGNDCDLNGDLAARGKADATLLEKLLNHPFFKRHLPKTTGREEFGHEFAKALFSCPNPFDALATATQLTSSCIAHFINANIRENDLELIVGGGGVHNRTLMKMLQHDLPNAHVLRHEVFGIDSNAKEALAFAILAYETNQGIPTNVTGATGANKRVVLGQVTRY